MLENEYFVFTGTLTTMTRKQAQSIITGLKGHNQNGVTERTTRLVTGYSPIDLIKGYIPSQKLVDTEQAIQLGQEIIIMNEKEFINFLSQRFYLISQGL
ncbi:BRCT domain-containing protein [Lactococcus lactis]|uniref:BRCT domain-containing protein n=1 Tax=Lactococcus lactis TaxID=1358 RepID=UPI001D17DB52|nr:BRCT domain-containing protein [Lactococcus lactis]MCC4121482.1 BRCT domain-containing protein [Lactococcus lactis]